MRWFKRIAIGAAILFAVAAAGLIVLVLAVDPNHYKGPLADEVKTRYGRTLRMDGDLRLSVFPRLGVEADKVSLSEPRSTQIFAAVDTARVAVAVLPLLSGRIVIDQVQIEGLKANVVRYRSGKFNFDDLFGGSEPQPSGKSAGRPLEAQGRTLEFDVAGIEFTGGELAVRDYLKGVALRVERLAVSTGRVAPRRPFEFDVSARVLGQSPRVDATVQGLGRLAFDPAQRSLSIRSLDLKASGVLPSVRASALTARGDLQVDGQRGAIDASGVTVVFQGDVAGSRPLTGVDLRLDAPRLAVGLAEGRLQAERLALAVQGKLGSDPFELSLAAPKLDVSPQQARGEPVSGQLRLGADRGLLAKVSLSGISGSADKLAIERLALEGEFKQGERLLKLAAASPVEASLQRKTVALPQLAGQLGILDSALPGGQMQAPLKGSLRANIEREQVTGRLEANIDGGTLNATAELAQFDEPRIAFTLAADTLDLDKLWPASPPGGGGGASAKATADAPVDLSALEGLTASGTVKIGKLVARGVKAANVSASVRVAKGRADVSAMKASLYGGTLSGSLFADAPGRRIGLAPTLSNVSVQPLLADLLGKDTLTGRGSIALNLTATGATESEMKRSLNGTAAITLRDGAIKGLDVAQALRQFRAMLPQRKDDAQQHQAAQQTEFSELQAQLVFAAGIGTVRSLDAKAPPLRITQGQPARIDIPGERLDLVLLATVANPSAKDGKELLDLRNVTVPVHVNGKFDAPAYTVQWSKVAAEVFRHAIVDKIEEGLGVERGETGDKLRDTVRERLKGLFNR
ncbi:putative assembly protein [Pigmentiphaga humi]|uniref:Putative assembly protein n=1 Tax=Pigmentiphaga humi TaxID=2478468 RepID=A0A3P4AZ40_9BURK|nr:AsmA family protein [Pigmentiphaga humi]VCU68740.1 putative assembly protein [Pigmentiphaga humi]